MKKILNLIIIIILSFTLVACGSNTYKTVNVIQCFGNQSNQLNSWYAGSYLKCGDWIYTVLPLSSEQEGIVRYQINSPEKYKTIYKSAKTNRLFQVSKFNDWIYFIEGTGPHGVEKMQLIKVKNDGSQKTELVNNIEGYVLGEKSIYYQKPNWFNKTSFYSSDFNGNKRGQIGKISNTDYISNHFLGIYNGWIYYMEYDSGDEEGTSSKYSIYKFRADGSEKQELLGDILYEGLHEVFNLFIPENDSCYFMRTNDDATRIELIKNTSAGKENTLASASSENKCALNKDGEWIYFSADKRLYKVHESGGEKKLIYEANQYIDKILIFNGDVIIDTKIHDTCIMKDGTVIELH